MTDFSHTDDLREAQFRNVDLTGARFRGCNFSHVKMTDMWLVDVELDGMIGRVTVNGVDVVPLVVAELDRRHPERTLLRANDLDRMRQGWATLTEIWNKTIERALRLPPERLFESVDEEWSFAQTLRHLVFATDKWFTHSVLGEDYDPIGIPNTGTGSVAFLGIDEDADPTIDEILTSRRDRIARVTEYLANSSSDDLDRAVAVLGAGNPPVRTCLHVVFDEEWAHHRYVTRDLGVLEGS